MICVHTPKISKVRHPPRQARAGPPLVRRWLPARSCKKLRALKRSGASRLRCASEANQTTERKRRVPTTRAMLNKLAAFERCAE